MKPSSPNTAGFTAYLSIIFKKRIFLLFLILGSVSLILPFVVTGFLLPPGVSAAIIFIGFVWRAFQVHQELSLAYQKAITPIPFEKNRRSGVTVSFTPGHEYGYSISDPYAGQDVQITRLQNTKGMNCRFDERGIFFINDQVYYMMGKGGLEINVQLLNSGDVPLEITAIHVYDDLDLNHLRIYNDGLFQYGSRLRLPVQLESGEIVTIQSRHKISSTIGSSDALFAADLRALPRFIVYEVVAETVDKDDRRQTHASQIKTPSSSLTDLYVKQWREYNQEEYLVLAGRAQIEQR